LSTETHVDELIGVYALGALSQAERAAVEEHLAGCERCRSLAKEARDIVNMLPHGIEPVTPSAQLKRALLARVDADLAAQRKAGRAFAAPQPRFRRWTQALALASLVLAVIFGGWALALRGELNRLRAENRTLATQVEQYRTVLAVLTVPELQAKALASTGATPDAQGRLLGDLQQTTALLTVSGLSPLPAGRIYQFWLIRDNTPVPAGLFTVDQNGKGYLLVHVTESIGTFQLGAITIEPASGSPLPTSDPLLAGNL
jgi:anti-sigma-K factor RskA